MLKVDGERIRYDLSWIENLGALGRDPVASLTNLTQVTLREHPWTREVLRGVRAPGIKARIVVEGANAPTTPEGDRIMHDNGITVVPDILANSGGVIVSYFEWVQDKQNYFWSADQIKENLESMMMRAFAEVRQLVKEKNVSWRDAAMMIGVGRVAEAHKLRGLYP